MNTGKTILGKTGILLAGMLMCFGMTAFAAPSVEGDTELTIQTDQTVTAEYTITSDEDMEAAKLTLSYDKDAVTYMSGSGGNNFSGSGGNGSIELSSKPNDTTASFTVKFKGKEDGDTSLTITGCTITVDGKEVDVLSGETASDEETKEQQSGEEEADEEESDTERASFVIDERTFYVHRPEDIEGFEAIHMDIQGIDSRVLKHNSLDLYVVRLYSDNGSYRDNFVYNPDTGNVIPFVEMKSGTDTVYFLEPEENVDAPVRYTYVDLGWGPKYTIPAYKHVIIDGVDEIFDDTNRYLVWGMNQDGEKAWYSYDYDKNSLQLFDDIAYTGEQNYITELEVKDEGLRSEAAYQLERYNNDMGRRLGIILVLTLIVIVLLNVAVLQHLRIRKLQMPDQEDDEDDADEVASDRHSSEYITGSLEENETDFQEPDDFGDELEIIDLDDTDEED